MSVAVPEFLSRETWFRQVVQAKTLPADTKLRKGLPGASPLINKAIDLTNRVVALVVSTGAEDRSKDIVTQSGWELDDFRAIPTVLFGHDHWSFPIGKGLDVNVVGDRLIALAQFATREESADADTAFNLIAGGYLKGVSAGFKPSEWTYDEERGGVNYLKQLLLEASLVPVPDNQTCMALKAAKAAGIDLAPWKIHAEKALDTKAAPDLQAWFATLYCLGGSTMKGKTVHLGQVLSAALHKATTDEHPRATLVASMAEKAGVDVAGMESILKGEAEESPSLAALDGVAGVVAAPVDEVVVATAADVAPATPAATPDPPAPLALGAVLETPPTAPVKVAHDLATCTEDGCTDPSHEGAKSHTQTVVEALAANTKAMQENAAASREVLAELKKRPQETPPAAPAVVETKAADDDEIDLDNLDEEKLAPLIAKIFGEKFTSLTGRLAQ